MTSINVCLAVNHQSTCFSTSVSKRRVHVNNLPVSVVTVTSCPGFISLTLLGRLMVYRSWPVKPRVSASSPGLKHKGTIPMPTRLLRWILSKLFAITALTPYNHESVPVILNMGNTRKRQLEILITTNIKELTCSIGPFAAQSRELPLPYSAPASMIVSWPSSLYLCRQKSIKFRLMRANSCMILNRTYMQLHAAVGNFLCNSTQAISKCSN